MIRAVNGLYCPWRVFSKSDVKTSVPKLFYSSTHLGLPCKNVSTECSAKVSNKSVCWTNMFHKTVAQDRPTRVSCNNVSQRSFARVSGNV